MKNLKPLHIVFIGSLILTGYAVIVMGICSLFFEEVDFGTVFTAALILGVGCFITFYVIVKQLINDRLNVLFRIIRKGNVNGQEDEDLSLNQDVISLAAKETMAWDTERQKEIHKLKEQEAFRREFLGNLAHELKTPVFSIQGYILTLLEGGLEDENVNRKFLERASRATDRITTILEDLDQITKMEFNRFELNVEKFDIVELTQEVIDSLEIPSKEKDIELKFNKDYEPILVEADQVRIAQVLTNLIANSINYGKEGGKTVIRFYPMDDVIMTEVSDNGPGISEDDLPRLFERFYRVEQSRNRNEGGSGLGLAIVKHIIETQHQQTINVRSTVDVGSTFSFTLQKANRQKL